MQVDLFSVETVGLTFVSLSAQMANRIGEGDRLCLMVEELGGLDKIEALQSHNNEAVYKSSFNIIETFFSDKVGVAPNKVPIHIQPVGEYDSSSLVKIVYNLKMTLGCIFLMIDKEPE